MTNRPRRAWDIWALDAARDWLHTLTEGDDRAVAHLARRTLPLVEAHRRRLLGLAALPTGHGPAAARFTADAVLGDAGSPTGGTHGASIA